MTDHAAVRLIVHDREMHLEHDGEPRHRRFIQGPSVKSAARSRHPSSTRDNRSLPP
jgi:hypothetical protein